MMRRVFVFFFKQKTAYEMRISDWSSDVCSSDLREALDSHGLVDACKARPPYRQNDCPGAAGSQFVALRRKIQVFPHAVVAIDRSEEHTSELQSLMRISYAVFCLKKKKNTIKKYQDN